MRRAILLAGLVVTVGVLLSGSAFADVGGRELAVKGRQSGYCTVNVSVVPWQGHCITTGPISHFGLATTEQDIQVVPTGPGTLSWSATATVMAANGDQIFSTGAGTSSTLDGVHFTLLGHYVSTDGTGRFTDASLTIDTTAQVTNLSLEGAILTQSVKVRIVGTLSH